ncbi:sigma 54-interacting transcriptional regulator [Lutispora saccharofermentans]|uniref:Sigma 54-interacting transcriptional regulator n=1 Tax=Lutispora saccharofermentans TaxID=3024236 RepID=A0ABT1NJ94_9FIRM|nr:sigma 54-interacting transcriptional regulator [Lutispora saccharofermentans]MCQ1530223.1 sigma 54-interacting transcriptional regulator [Lutispora saccharofermentans]
MKIKIALLGYKGFTERAEKYIQYLKNVEVCIYSSLGYESLPLAQKLQNEGIDAIVTGQTNYIQVKDKVSIPVIPFRVTFVDAVNAFTQALKFEEKTVALMYPSFDDFEFDFVALADFIGLNIVQLTYNSICDLKKKIADLKQQGIKLLIGTTLAVSICKDYGIRGIEIYSVESIIYASIDKAIEVVKAIREKRSNEIFRDLIINNVHEGIVYIDEFGKIHIFNDEAARLFKLEGFLVIGKHIDEIASDLRLTDTLRTGDIEINSIEVIRNMHLSVSRIPIKINNKVVGVISTFQNAENIENIGDAIRRIKRADGFIAKYTFDSLIGKSPIFLSTINLSKKYARSDLPILVEGETGTGKELFVQSIHNYSYRKNYPFVAINCASLPENLLESELFGYEPGSFTGASSNGKKGLFEIADEGTLFLDEINSIPKNFQAKLLRVIEEKEIIRIGGKRIIPVNVRIIATSNVSIRSMINNGEFREDLYYRIGTLKINIPPLRDRMSDLPYLIEGLSSDINIYKNYDFRFIYNKMCQKLMGYDFPGNIRELKMFINRFFILLDENRVEDMLYIDNLINLCVGDMLEEINIYSKGSQSFDIIEQNEKRVIMSLLEQYKNNKSLVAKHMGIGRNTLYRKMKKLNIYDF